MRQQIVKDELVTDSTGQKQDPVERRRLQNRLSQRNHRRKIRDRIAKLQERVIASELRAAASMNGWGYPNTGPSLDPVPPHEVDGNTIPPASENVPHFEPYYPAPGICPACSNSMGSIPIPCSQALTPSIYGSPPKEPESAHSSPPSITNSFYEAGLNFSGPDLSSALSSFPVAELNGPVPSDSWDQTQRSSSALYYVATEVSLPQIMQTLGSGASRTNALILIPQAQGTGISASSPMSQSPTSVESAPPISRLSMQGCGCQFQGPDVAVGLPNPGLCPMHSTQNYPSAML